uniref:Uncharacterized protein n=1 Tax=Haptolina brevifila TaxID=156173 RepID=A0A7S2JBN4_9EUKA|mmetsp:Transcript_79089/g.157233  ORF Transcript_79089/g.157233 Transcript_79089/m.157233 type:complete len:165 (+) Transcript_79089:1470-1964(+)
MEPLVQQRAAAQRCTHSQLAALTAFQSDFMAKLLQSSALHRRGNGAFIHGCHSHCPGNLGRFTIGDTTLTKAWLAWWRSPVGNHIEDHAQLNHPHAATSMNEHVHVGCLTNWSDLSERRGGGQRCRPRCGPLYGWPDERAKIRARQRQVERALLGRISPELKQQ